MQTCYRHPSRETGVSCSSCGRPICTACMTTTPVGMRCPECSAQKTKVRTMRDVHGEPRVTYALIAINVLAFFAASAGGDLSDRQCAVGIAADQFESKQVGPEPERLTFSVRELDCALQQ